MPNWVDQDLHVVGPRSEIDRFIRVGRVPRKRGESFSVLDFTRLCPLKPRERKDTYKQYGAAVLSHFRTRTQALFSIDTAWDYPAAFYARLPKHWPQLSFISAINEDMGQFGGIVMVHQDEVVDLVRDYDRKYSRRQHAREIEKILRRWGIWLTDGRDWRLIPHEAWKHGSMPFDAHFDDDFWFYFKTRDELARFKARYKASHVMRREGDIWVRARA